jgi:PST family polysaccharide transporter
MPAILTPQPTTSGRAEPPAAASPSPGGRRLPSWVALLAAGSPEAAAFRVNVGWQLADRAFRLVVGLVINVWIVRYLGTSGLGLLGFTQSLVGLAAVAGELGLESIVVRDLVRRPGEAADILGTAAGLRLAGAGVALLVSLAAALVSRPGDGTVRALTLLFASVTFFQAMDVITWWFQSRASFPPFVAARGAAFVLASAAKVACLVGHARIEVLAAAIALEGWLAALGLLLAYRREGRALGRWRFQAGLARQLLADGWPLILNSVAIVFALRTDQVMLTLMRGEAENGLYAAAQRLSEILYFIPVAIAAAANPGLLRLHLEDPERYRQRLGRVLRLVLWTAIALAVPLSLLAGPLTRLLFGEPFHGSAPVLSLHLWAAPALFLGVAQSNWFIAEGRQRELMLRSAIGAAVNIALNVLLIPTLGARGSALATLLAHFVAHVLVNALVPHTRPLFRLQCRALLPWEPR